MTLVERAKAILQTPKTEWPKIGADAESPGSLFWNYAAPLALIPPVAAYVGMAFTGYVGYRIDPALGSLRALIVYLLSLGGIVVMAFVIDALAGAFGGTRNFTKAMKIAIFAPTAAWVACIFCVQPPMAFLSLMGLYSFYLLHTGIVALMKPSLPKELAYTIAVSFAMFLLWSFIAGALFLAFGLHAFV